MNRKDFFCAINDYSTYICKVYKITVTSFYTEDDLNNSCYYTPIIDFSISKSIDKNIQSGKIYKNLSLESEVNIDEYRNIASCLNKKNDKYQQLLGKPHSELVLQKIEFILSKNINNYLIIKNRSNNINKILNTENE